MAVTSSPATRTPPRTDRRHGRGDGRQDSLPLGRILGVRVGLNWSMLLVFWLVAWSLADSLLPDAAPGASALAYWTAALIGTLLFYASLLAHELAHSVLARSHGVVVEGITLWLFGGVSRLHGDAPSARAELRIAAVGPLTSIALAVAGVLVSMGLAMLAAPALVVSVAVWLAAVNGMLAVFNLLPAFPLDGGRVLRAVLWRRRGDRVSATRSAAQAGTVLGWALSLLGAVELVATGSIGGLWLMLVGWFVVGAARGEAAQSILRDVLHDVRVADVMSPSPVLVPDWIVLREFLDAYVMRRHVTSFPVRDFEGHVDGLVTLSQTGLAAPDHGGAQRVRDVMWPLDQVATARPDEPLTDLLERMNEFPATRALVFDAGRLVGIVSPSDVSRMLQVAARRGAAPR
jgi:Zn-dependent protease